MFEKAQVHKLLQNDSYIWYCIAGFALLMVWAELLPMFWIKNADVSLAHGTPRWFALGGQLAVQGLIGFAVIPLRGFLIRRSFGWADVVGFSVASSLASCAALVLSGSWIVGDSAIQVIISGVWMVLGGFVQVVFYLRWTERLSLLPPHSMVVVVFAVMFFQSIVLAVLSALPLAYRSVLACACIPCSAVCIYKTNKTNPPAFAKKPDSTKPMLPVRILATGFVTGAIMGFYYSEVVAGMYGTMIWQNSRVLPFVLAASLLLVCVNHFRQSFNTMLYRVALPVIGLGAFALIVFYDTFSLAYNVTCFGYCFCLAAMWCLCGYLVRVSQRRGLLAAALFIGALWLGRGIGFLVTPCVDASLVTVGASMMLAAFATALYCFDKNNLLNEWGMVRVAESSIHNRSFDRACMLIAQDVCLSTREIEVFRLMVVRQMSRNDIARELNISSETVKSHVRHIYLKCGLSSRDELLAQVTLRANALKNTSLSEQ